MTIRYGLHIGLITAAICTGVLTHAVVVSGNAMRPTAAHAQVTQPAIEEGSHANGLMESGFPLAALRAIQDRLVALERAGALDDFPATRTLVARVEQLEAGQQALRQMLESGSLDEAVFIAQAPHADPVEASGNDILDYEQRFWAESEDTDWTHAMQADVDRILEAEEVEDAYVDFVKCHQNACRIDFVHPQGDGATGFVEAIHTSDALTGEFYAESLVDDDGQLRTLIYVARQGEQLFEREP